MSEDDDPVSMGALKSFNNDVQAEIGGLHFATSIILQTLIKALDQKDPGLQETVIRSLKATWEGGHRAVGDDNPIVANMLDHLQGFVSSLEDK